MNDFPKKTKRRVWRLTLAGLAPVLALIPIVLLVRARFLPEVEVPILLYHRVERIANDAATVPLDLFHLQMNDLARNGYRTVSPGRLRAYKTWGMPLPEKPLVITFDYAWRSLLTDVAPILREQHFTAVVFLATTYISASPGDSHSLDGEPMMTWKEVRAAMDDGVFEFGGHTRNLVDLTRHVKPFNEIRASRTDIKRATGVRSGLFSYPHGRFSPELTEAARKAKIRVAMTHGDEPARIGPHTDMLALPRLRVVGGSHAFSVKVVERRSPGSFGVIRVRHPDGPAFPCSIIAYGRDSMEPVASVDSEGFEGDETLEIPLPAGVRFPVDVEILDKDRVLIYFAGMIPRDTVEREFDSSGTPLNIDYPFDLDPID